MMQDGQAASFALHIEAEKSAIDHPLFQSNKTLEWAWSSNVRHAVIANPATNEVIVRRWDDPAYRESRGLASARDMRNLVKSLEKPAKANASPTVVNVISSTLYAFDLLRSAIEQDYRGTQTDIVIAFNVALLLAEEWRDSPTKIPSIGLGEAIRELHGESTIESHGFGEPLGQRVQDYPIGDFVAILLNQKDSVRTPYLLDAELLIRHASGLLNQEAHRHLAKELPPGYQPKLFHLPFSSIPSGRRTEAPGFIRHTPPWLARSLVECALNLFESTKDGVLDVLDPACGSGVFLVETLRELEQFPNSRVQLRGMELSPVAGLMADFCLDQVTRDLVNVSARQQIRYGIDSLQDRDWGRPDVILMNPPFKAWEKLDEKSRNNVTDSLGSLMAGRPDLSHAFVVRAAQSLSIGGVLAFIVPSSFFNSIGTASIRAFLSGGDFRIRMVMFFHGYKTFSGPLVEAAAIVVSRSDVDTPIRIVIADEGREEQTVRLLRSTEDGRTVRQTGIEIYNMPPGSLGGHSWILRGQDDLRFTGLLGSSVSSSVRDFFTVRLGVRGRKPLILTNEDYSRLVKSASEKKFFRPVADHIVNGRIISSGYLFYPYDEGGRLLLTTEKEVSDAVRAFYREILLPKQGELEARLHYRNWWEPIRPVTKWLALREPRIVSQEFGMHGYFAFDEDGHFAVSSGHGWCWKNGSATERILLPYVALINSLVFERLLSVVCPRLQGGQFNLAARYVHGIPLPDLTSGNGDELYAIGRRIHAGKHVDETELNSAVLAAYGVTKNGENITIIVEDKDDEKAFAKLAEQWRNETGMLSSLTKKIKHPAYQKIISMGEKAIPWILHELKDRPAHWFAALKAIAKESPVKPSERANPELARRSWLSWGKERGLI